MPATNAARSEITSYQIDRSAKGREDHVFAVLSRRSKRHEDGSLWQVVLDPPANPEPVGRIGSILHISSKRFR